MWQSVKPESTPGDMPQGIDEDLLLHEDFASDSYPIIDTLDADPSGVLEDVAMTFG